MKKIPFIIALTLTFVLEAAGCYFLFGKLEQKQQDPVAVNECLRSVAENFGEEEQYSDTLSYTILGENGEIIYTNKPGMSASINEAIRNQDLILDLVVEGDTIGNVIFDNEMSETFAMYRRDGLRILIISSGIQILILFLYYMYLKRTIVIPFKKLNAFAVRVANGNLDLPLMIDRKHIFGGFTEAFDLMRTELKKARIAEKKANDEKKEVIAKLSHDIKTPASPPARPRAPPAPGIRFAARAAREAVRPPRRRFAPAGGVRRSAGPAGRCRKSFCRDAG